MQLSYESAKQMADSNPDSSSSAGLGSAGLASAGLGSAGLGSAGLGSDSQTLSSRLSTLAARQQAKKKRVPGREQSDLELPAGRQRAQLNQAGQADQAETNAQTMLDTATSSPAEDYRTLMGFALRHLARREHSRVELQRKLNSRGVADELVRSVIEALTADGSLSDRRFAAEYVRSRIRKGYGPIRIRMDLIERGISDQLAEEQLTQPAEFWQKLATEVCDKKFDATKPSGEESADAQQRRWNRCARFLSQRGFPADLIYQALDGRIAN